jgi:hypothetical protein
MHQSVYHVVRRDRDQQWHIEERGHSIDSFASRETALLDAQDRAHTLRELGFDARVVAHRQDGSVEKMHIDPQQSMGLLLNGLV